MLALRAFVSQSDGDRDWVAGGGLDSRPRFAFT